MVLKRQGKLVHRDSYAEAIAAYRDAIERNPAFANAHLNLGIILKENGKFDEAINAYRQAISAKPNYPEAYSQLGRVRPRPRFPRFPFLLAISSTGLRSWRSRQSDFRMPRS